MGPNKILEWYLIPVSESGLRFWAEMIHLTSYHGITVSRYHDDPTYHKRRRFLQRQAVRHHRGGIVPDIYIKHWQHATAAGRHGTAEQMYGVKAIGCLASYFNSSPQRPGGTHHFEHVVGGAF